MHNLIFFMLTTKKNMEKIYYTGHMETFEPSSPKIRGAKIKSAAL